MREIVSLPSLNDALASLNTPTSLFIKSKGMLYSCGIPPLNMETGELILGTIEEQTHAVLSLMQKALEDAGSGLSQVVKITIFVTDTKYFGPVNDIYKMYFKSPYPVRSFVSVGPWPIPFDIEIECIAEV